VSADHSVTDTKTGKRTGRSVSWALGGHAKNAKLPTPKLSGRTALYENVLPGVDLRVQVRPSGFEQDFIVRDRSAADRLVAAGGSFQIPLKTKGLTGRKAADGGIEFVDSKGVVVSTVPAAFAWDAQIDARSGEPAARVPVALAVTQPNQGNAVLSVTPDAGWLADPGRVFPVTIDPTYAVKSVNTSWDLWVATNYPSTDTTADPELKAGTYDGGATKARSLIRFPNSGFKGYDVTSAKLEVYNTWSFSCSARAVTVYPSGDADSGTRWGNQPAIGSSAGSVSAAKGFSSSCAAGWISVPVTGLVQSWAKDATSKSQFWVSLRASETDSYGWKRFSSANGSYAPKLTVTYNRKPNLAAVPDLGGAADGQNSYTSPASGITTWFTSKSTPRLYSSATDPDGNQVSVTFEVHTDTSSPSSATLAATCATPFGASGSRVSCVPSKALANDTKYFVRAAVKDERGVWNGSWSAWRTFYTLWSPPTTPRVLCDRDYSAGAWTDADPAGTVTCSITAAGVAGTYLAPGYLDVTLDGVAQPRLTITATNDWNVVHKTVSFAASKRGYHEIKVTGVSRSLTVSPPVVHGFGWGSASLTLPATGTASSGSVSVSAGGPPRGTATTVTAKVRWRVAGAGNETSGWTDDAAGPVTVTPTGTATAAYKGVFDLRTAEREASASADLPTRIPVRLDLQVCFTYTGVSTSTQCTWSQSPVTVTRLPHAFGAGYPVADTGVGQVALFTGEVALDATDV
jgi:hypothetical protein